MTKVTKVELYQVQSGTVAVLVLNESEAWAVAHRQTFEVSFERDARALLAGDWFPSIENGQTSIPIEEFRSQEPQLIATAVAGEPTMVEDDVSANEPSLLMLTSAGRYLVADKALAG